MYGKIVDNELLFAPSVIYLSDRTVCNPTATILAEQGYKEILFTDMPEVPAGYYAQFTWVDGIDAITQTWEVVEIPADAELSSADVLNIILGGVQ